MSKYHIGDRVRVRQLYDLVLEFRSDADNSLILDRNMSFNEDMRKYCDHCYKVKEVIGDTWHGDVYKLTVEGEDTTKVGDWYFTNQMLRTQENNNQDLSKKLKKNSEFSKGLL